MLRLCGEWDGRLPREASKRGELVAQIVSDLQRCTVGQLASAAPIARQMAEDPQLRLPDVQQLRRFEAEDLLRRFSAADVADVLPVLRRYAGPPLRRGCAAGPDGPRWRPPGTTESPTRRLRVDDP